MIIKQIERILFIAALNFFGEETKTKFVSSHSWNYFDDLNYINSISNDLFFLFVRFIYSKTKPPISNIYHNILCCIILLQSLMHNTINCFGMYTFISLSLRCVKCNFFCECTGSPFNGDRDSFLFSLLLSYILLIFQLYSN